MTEANHSLLMMNHDLITEILSWLPVESLVRFKCVCRSWNSLISNPSFVKFHFHKSSRHHNLLFTSQPFINNRVSDSFVMFCSKRDLLTTQHSTFVATLTATQESHIPLNHGYHVIGCCNGLVCLAGSTFSHNDYHSPTLSDYTISISHDDYTHQFWIHFWNPAMRLTSEKSPSLFLKFSSSITPIFGFGNDESSDTYKVVVVFANRSLELTMRTKVYTMGGDSWRDIQDFPGFFYHDMLSSMGSFLSGTLNWVAFQAFQTSSELSIVSLDLGKETFNQLLLPPEVLDQVYDVLPPEFLDKPDQVHDVPTLGVLMDCLCVSQVDKKATHFVVWQMKVFGDEKSWTQIMKVCYQPLLIDRSMSYWAMFPVCMSENGDVLMLKDAKKQHGTLVYNRRDNTVHAHISLGDNIADFKDYVQSLVLPY